MSYLKTALKVVKQDQEPKTETKIRLVEKKSLPMTEARLESLQAVMDAIILTSRDRIIEAHQGRQYKANDEIRKAEHEIEELQREVLTGQVQLADFQKAVKTWELVCLEEVSAR